MHGPRERNRYWLTITRLAQSRPWPLKVRCHMTFRKNSGSVTRHRNGSRGCGNVTVQVRQVFKKSALRLKPCAAGGKGPLPRQGFQSSLNSRTFNVWINRPPLHLFVTNPAASPFLLYLT